MNLRLQLCPLLLGSDESLELTIGAGALAGWAVSSRVVVKVAAAAAIERRQIEIGRHVGYD